MADPVRLNDRHYTYGEYRHWPEDDRWELIEGVAYAMSSPTSFHQAILVNLARIIGNHLKGKPCKVFFAPLDILFPRLEEQDENDVDTVVQPDLVVVCDRSRIRPYGVWGAPDLVVEILSPSTSRKDFREKYNLYQRSGVKEYWVIDPPGRWLHQYLLEPSGSFGPQNLLVAKGTLTSPVLEGLSVDLETLWPDF